MLQVEGYAQAIFFSRVGIEQHEYEYQGFGGLTSNHVIIHGGLCALMDLKNVALHCKL